MIKPKSKLMRRIAVLLVMVLIAVGVFFGVKKFPWKTEFVFAGTIEATKVDLSSQLSSTISQVLFREGDQVKVDQELVTLSCEDFKITSALANKNYNRNLSLFQIGTVSADTLEQFKNKKDEADLKLKWCTLSAPIDGTILSRYREPGEWVSPGMKLLTLANIKDVWTYIYVPQIDIANLNIGMKLKGVVPETGREFIGSIVKINSEAEFTPKNVQTRSERTRLVFGLKVSFLESNKDEYLKPGMTIEMKLPKE